MILGAVNYDPDFQYESGTESKGGCSITLKGQMWYLGGSQNKRQVKKYKINYRIKIQDFKASRIIDYKLVKQANLPFDFYLGSCSTFEPFNELALMCFDQAGSQTKKKECHTLV